MYDVSSKFNVFYRSYVVLPQSEQSELFKKKDLNIQRLKDGLEEYNSEHKTDYKVVDTCVQGSVAMSTVVQNEDSDYDIDVAVIFDKADLRDKGAQATRNIVANALKRKTKQFNAEPEVKTSCVRIKYADGYHIDFAIYQRYYDECKDDWVYEHAGSDWTERELTGLKGRHDSFKITHERQSNKYLFSTLIKCKECGWSFRRTVRQYKNTYVRWVCSGHNGKGADSCPNAVTVDEEELIQALQEYFQEILSKKKKVINYVIKEFQRVYKAKDENIEYEKQLNAELNKLRKSREKYMDMYTDDLISREELNEKIGGMRKEIERLENELKMVSYHLTKGEQLEAILNSTFKQLEDITDVHEMTNAQLKRLINKIEVDKDGNVDIYLRLIGDLGLDETVLIEGDKNTEEKGTKKVPNSYNHT